MVTLRLLNITFSFLLITSILVSQENLPQKEIIIIEKTVDDQGNVISQSTKRYNGMYTEDQIQDLLEESNDGPSIRSYDLDGLGFEDNFQDLFQMKKAKKPTIGVNLSFENQRASVDKVFPNSGAYEADIRRGDELISIANLPISTIEDVHQALENKSSGDRIKMLIFRDGEEMEKEIRLGVSNQGGFPLNFGEGGNLRMFEDDSFGFSFDLDSLFEGMLGGEGFFQDLGLGDDRVFWQDEQAPEERASLGVFIEDAGLEVTVTEVVQDSPADRSGVEAGDIIKSLDGNIVTSFREVSAYMNRKKIGDTLMLELSRQGVIKTLEVSL